jgi:hypothetical protein
MGSSGSGPQDRIGLGQMKLRFRSYSMDRTSSLLTPSFFKRLESPIKQRVPPLDLKKRGILIHMSDPLINFLISDTLEMALSCKV